MKTNPEIAQLEMLYQSQQSMLKITAAQIRQQKRIQKLVMETPFHMTKFGKACMSACAKVTEVFSTMHEKCTLALSEPLKYQSQLFQQNAKELLAMATNLQKEPVKNQTQALAVLGSKMEVLIQQINNFQSNNSVAMDDLNTALAFLQEEKGKIKKTVLTSMGSGIPFSQTTSVPVLSIVEQTSEDQKNS